jgi:uncharacterized Zn ribbon protein
MSECLDEGFDDESVVMKCPSCGRKWVKDIEEINELKTK